MSILNRQGYKDVLGSRGCPWG